MSTAHYTAALEQLLTFTARPDGYGQLAIEVGVTSAATTQRILDRAARRLLTEGYRRGANGELVEPDGPGVDLPDPSKALGGPSGPRVPAHTAPEFDRG